MIVVDESVNSKIFEINKSKVFTTTSRNPEHNSCFSLIFCSVQAPEFLGGRSSS